MLIYAEAPSENGGAPKSVELACTRRGLVRTTQAGKCWSSDGPPKVRAISSHTAECANEAVIKA